MSQDQNTYPNRFHHSIKKYLNQKYFVNGKVVFGQSETHLRQCLRDDRWRNLTRLDDDAKRAGFKVERGRGQRIYHGGVMKWGVECVVIHEGREVPCFDKHEAYLSADNYDWPYIEWDRESQSGGHYYNGCIEREMN